mmetsp:Transcript_6220/g.16055  ORF Transcript_6220/g.16055 Transcript_6220/m.16055 type:complete len:243 (-) Transcript_6220:1420-2148(-)
MASFVTGFRPRAGPGLGSCSGSGRVVVRVRFASRRQTGGGAEARSFHSQHQHLHLHLHQQQHHYQLRSATRRPRAVQANATWKRNTAEVEVPVSVDTCFQLWQDRPRIPEWMQWIKSVDVLEEDPRLSQWSLETQQFGQTFRFSWLARNMAPIKHRLIHWVSVDDPKRGILQGFVSVMNKGEIQFRTLSPDSCVVRLVISYQLPSVLEPLVDLLKPTVDGILMEYMQNFKTVAIAEQSAQQE